MEFEGKVVVVTGAARGIGQGIAVAFGKEKAFVVIADLDEKQCSGTVNQVLKSGGRAAAISCDVSSAKDVKNLFDFAIKKFGTIDILVNNAGIFPFKPFNEMTEADWDQVIAVNLKSVFLTCKEASKIMVSQRKKGRIVNISSIASLIGYPMLAHYCASKGGISGFTRSLALELAKNEITVNAVAPGPINTRGVGAMDEKTKAAVLQTIPVGRMGEPEDIANAVLFLASEKSGFVTGHLLVVDGGATIQ